MSGIRDGIEKVLDEYAAARQETFKKHSLGEFVRGSLSEAIRSTCSDRLLVKGSVGQGTWAETPWVSIFDPRITTSAQRGVYVVYLFDQLGRHVYLSLNQATTEVKDEYKSKFELVLRDRAEFASELLRPYQIDDLLAGDLDLTGSQELTRGYCAGNIAAFIYPAGSIPSEELLVRDLSRLLNLYSTYVSVRNGEVGEGEELPDGVQSGTEAKKYRWHRRAERNPRLAADAKKFHGSTCMVCGFNFEQRYGVVGRNYIEAHHIKPFAELVKELEPVTLDPRTDFIVTCANCHRMLHRSSPPIEPQQLKQMLK